LRAREPIRKSMDSKLRQTKSNSVVNLGLFSNILLAVVKTLAGIFGHSPALLADGINSTSDVAYYIVVKIFVGMAGEPPDPEHPYGHRQLESIAALVVGAFILTTSIAIFWNSINAIFDIFSGKSDFSGAAHYAFWIAIATIVLKLFIFDKTRKTAGRTKNPAVMALAYDHRNDIFSSAAAALGIFFGRIGYYWIDPLAGAVVALVILKTGVHILQASSSDLMDTVPGEALEVKIKDALAEVSGIKAVEEIYAHRFGPYFVVNITICIEGNLSVDEGDRIATAAEEKIMEKIEFVKKVHVHYHPERCR